MITTIVLAVCWAATILAFLRRDTLREQRFDGERAVWAQERRELNQRIQAPHVAIGQQLAADQPQGLLYVPVDDDEAFNVNLEEQLNGD